MKSLEKVMAVELIATAHEAIGEASMCWSKPEGAGEFDSTRAGKIATELCWKIANHYGWPENCEREIKNESEMQL